MEGRTDRPYFIRPFQTDPFSCGWGPKIYLCTWQNVNNKAIPIKVAKNLSLFPPLLPWKKSDHLKRRSRVIHMVIQMRLGWFTYATPNVDHAADFKKYFPLIYLWAKTYFKVIALLFFLNFGPDFVQWHTYQHAPIKHECSNWVTSMMVSVCILHQWNKLSTLSVLWESIWGVVN